MNKIKNTYFPFSLKKKKCYKELDILDEDDEYKKYETCFQLKKKEKESEAKIITKNYSFARNKIVKYERAFLNERAHFLKLKNEKHYEQKI